MHNYLSTSEFSPWEPVAVPPRSRLYHMVPAGIGTGLVESATGYSSRLALAHNVTLAVLFGYEIAPLLDKNHLRNSEARSNKNAVLSNSFRTLAPAVDGHGIIAETYIASLQKLTMRADLRFLTMLPCKEVLSHRQLIRPKRAWCSACYDEWHRDGSTLYEPLAWSLAAITACLVHRQLLQTRCHRCKHELRHLASRSHPGYCDKCHAWLGEAAQTGFSPEEFLVDDEYEWQNWVYKQTCNLLAAAPTLTTSLQRPVLAASISRCIRASIFKTEVSFARTCGISQSSVNDLCRGASVPQLSTLLKISFLTKIPVVDIVLGKTSEAVGKLPPDNLNNEPPQVAKVTVCNQHWTTRKVRKVRQQFEGLLKEAPPFPMVKIKERLNHPRSTLLSRFPDLCQQAVVGYKAHVENRRQVFWDRVREKIDKQLIDKAPLSVAEVARQVGRSRTAVISRFPELCARLSEYWIKRHKERWNEIETFLQNSLESNSPLRLRDIAKQLKLSHTSLYEHFPQLCRKIAECYALHLQQSRVLKKESLSNEVRRIAISLHNQGVYPSVREVEKHLAKPISLRSSKAALASLREVRRASGFSSKTRKQVGETHQ